MSTIEGGAILTDNNELYKILKILRAHGWVRDVLDKKNLILIINLNLYYLDII